MDNNEPKKWKCKINHIKEINKKLKMSRCSSYFHCPKILALGHSQCHSWMCQCVKNIKDGNFFFSEHESLTT